MSDEKKCPSCAEMVKAEAAKCRYCGHEFQALPTDHAAAPSAKTGMGKAGKGCLVIIGVFVALIIFAAIVGGGEKDEKASGTAPSVEADKAGPADTVTAPQVSKLTKPQQNAARSAQQYINMSGFSRKGLIEQLSSEAGDGYVVADATAAVDSLSIDWNEQAVRSAKQYLNMTGFSCKGLIEQLSSSAGDDYSVSEATYGAKQAGAC